MDATAFFQYFTLKFDTKLQWRKEKASNQWQFRRCEIIQVTTLATKVTRYRNAIGNGDSTKVMVRPNTMQIATLKFSVLLKIVAGR